MSVRKRIWTTDKGEPREAWVVDYSDQLGTRHLKTFARKRDADAYHAQVAVDVGAGVHTPDSRAITITEAGELWLAGREAAGLERSTLDQYRNHLDLHISPLIGKTKLSAVTVPFVRAFEDRLREDRSPAMVRKIMVSLSSMLSDAQERGLVAQNAAHRLRAKRQKDSGRQKHGLQIGVDIPAPAEIRAVITNLEGRWRPMLLTAIFTGLRASELRGLSWNDVDLQRAELHVRQRADHYGKLGRPKSSAGQRTIPLLPIVAAHSRECITRVKACLSAEQPQPRIPRRRQRPHQPDLHRQAGMATCTDCGRGGQCAGSSQVPRPSQPASLLRKLVHQPSARWRT